METHNTPSALDPYGGALDRHCRGEQGSIRDGQGREALFNTDVFCFAPPDYKGDASEASPSEEGPRWSEGGVEHGGNKSGIPTVNGSLVFDEGFLGKPLVFCGTCGIMPVLLGEGPRT